MELRQLKYFVTIAKTLSYSKASKMLYITQGTLSQQIQQLENELGTQLFDRTSHSVSLTEAGQEMLPLAERTIESSMDCFQKISDLKKGLCGTLTIGLTTSFRRIMTDTIKNFISNYPKVQLNIVYGTVQNLMPRLRDHELDLMLAFKPSVLDDSVELTPLISTSLCAIMSKDHPLAGHPKVTMDELKQQRIVLPGAGLQARKAFDQYVNFDTSKLNVCIQINNPNGIIRLVRGTRLVAIMSSLAAVYDTSLIAVPIEGIERPMTGCIHTIKGKYSKKSALAFIEQLKEQSKYFDITQHL